MESIFTRRSIRQYQDKKVEKEKIEKLLRAAMQAPSAGNQQPWEFIVVENKEKLKELSGMSLYSKLIEKTPLAIVILGNEERMRFPENWEQDLGAATQNLLLQATELELGAVWMSAAPLTDRMEHVRKTFNLKENLKPYCVVAIGYPLEGKGNHFIDRFDETRVQYFPSDSNKPKVAFVCVHNSCRSQMAEALGKHLASEVFESYSAGTELRPQINQDAVRIIKQLHDIDMNETQYSKLLEDIPEVDIVVTMGCNVQCPNLPCKHREDWGIEDPSGKEDEVFIETAEAIKCKILDLKERIKEGKL